MKKIVVPIIYGALGSVIKNTKIEMNQKFEGDLTLYISGLSVEVFGEC